MRRRLAATRESFGELLVRGDRLIDPADLFKDFRGEKRRPNRRGRTGGIDHDLTEIGQPRLEIVASNLGASRLQPPRREVFRARRWHRRSWR